MPKRQKYLKKINIFLIKNDSNRENIILGTKKKSLPVCVYGK
jgi:hypothetical protein